MPFKINSLECFQEFQKLDTKTINRRLFKLYAFIICETHFETEDLESYNNEVIRTYIDEGGDLDTFFTSIKITDELTNIFKENNISEISNISIDQNDEIISYTILGKQYNSKKRFVFQIEQNLYFRNIIDNSMLSFFNNESIELETNQELINEVHVSRNDNSTKKPIISHNKFIDLDEF